MKRPWQVVRRARGRIPAVVRTYATKAAAEAEKQRNDAILAANPDFQKRYQYSYSVRRRR